MLHPSISGTTSTYSDNHDILSLQIKHGTMDFSEIPNIKTLVENNTKEDNTNRFRLISEKMGVKIEDMSQTELSLMKYQRVVESIIANKINRLESNIELKLNCKRKF